MNPDEIELRNTSQQFEYEKMSREIDECDDVDTLQQMCKFLVKLEMKTRETYSIVLQDALGDNEMLKYMPDLSQPKE
tara:strand:+ start:441 stop:671 length:231 start_codon:yes stop_codon:yes gene_type:complete